MASFFGVAFVLFCFVSVFMLSLKPRSFVQSFFNMQPPDSHMCFFLFSFFGDVAFSEYFFWTVAVFSLYGKYVRFSFRMVFFNLITTGWIVDIINLCENSIN